MYATPIVSLFVYALAENTYLKQSKASNRNTHALSNRSMIYVVSTYTHMPVCEHIPARESVSIRSRSFIGLKGERTATYHICMRTFATVLFCSTRRRHACVACVCDERHSDKSASVCVFGEFCRGCGVINVLTLGGQCTVYR